jgi:hypothetical protein
VIVDGLNRLKEQLRALNGAQVIVGVQGEPGVNSAGETVSSDKKMLQIAYVHEFGFDIGVCPKIRWWYRKNGVHLKKTTTHIHIPERSYIRTAHANGKTTLREVYGDHALRMLRGEIEPEEVLEKLGVAAVEEVHTEMSDLSPPLSDLTMKKRKNKNPAPLGDKGTLFEHITYRVVQKGGDGSKTTFAAGDG